MRRGLLFLPLLSLLFFSCAKKETRLVLWTNNVDFVSCAELFNASQDKIKLVAYYKKSPVQELFGLPSAGRPDLLAGSYLHDGIEQKIFLRLDSLTKKNGPLKPETFYETLLNAGRKNDKQYLLPVSYNLPALVFYSGNYERLQNVSMLSFEDIKEISKKFNAKNSAGVWTAMGYGPLWSSEFLYLLFKDRGVYFNVGPKSISYTENVFSKSVDYVKEWVQDVNEGVKNERDFAFKYLYMPFYNQAQNGRCLFSFASSRDILTLPDDVIRNLDFRWICNDNKIQIEDDIVNVGIYSKSKEKAAAKKFIVWLLSENTQRKILDRKFKMNMQNDSFGIAGGFSSLKNSTERVFPLYYRAMISNTPVAERLAAPQAFPSNWAKIKEQVVQPYILDSCAGDAKIKNISQRYEDFLASEGK